MLSIKTYNYIPVPRIILFVLIFLITFSTHAQLWEEHGALRVSENGHFLEHEDGTGFFWLGCTAWMLSRLQPEDVDRYLDSRVEKNFNVIQFTSTNMGRINYQGEQPFLGDEGRPWKTMTPNEAYWKHVDYIVEKAKEKGLYVAIFVWWGTGANDPNWEEGKDSRMYFRDPDKHNYEFGKFLGERYNDEPHIIWVGAGEYHKPVSVMFPKNQRPLTETHARRLTDIIKGIRESDPEENHLYTIHPISFLSSSEEFHQADWLDFNMIQSHAVPEFIVPLTLADWHREPTKPTFNSEGWYENEHQLYERWTGMKRAKDDPVDPDWKQRYQGYWSVFAGGFGFTYGHKNLWRMENEEGKAGVLPQHILDAPGSSSLKHLRSLVESRPIQSRVPDPELVTAGTTGRDGGLSPDLRIGTRAEDGSWAWIYSTWGSLIRVNMGRLQAGEAQAFWYNPRSGQWHDGTSDTETKRAFQTGIPSGSDALPQYFDPPGSSGDGNDWVLVLEVAQ